MPNKSSTSTSQESQFQPWAGSSSFISQGRHWSSALIWLTAALFGSSVLWAFLGRIDQTISVRGKLEPSGSVFQLQSPSSGLVKEVYISDGDFVEQGQKLLVLESKGLSASRIAFEQSIQLLEAEASSLENIISSKTLTSQPQSLPIVSPVFDSEFLNKLSTARTQTDQIRAQLLQLSLRLQSREKSFSLQSEIVADIEPLYNLGAISRIAYLNKLNSLQELKAEIASLEGEKNKIIASATSQLNVSIAR